MKRSMTHIVGLMCIFGSVAKADLCSDMYGLGPKGGDIYLSLPGSDRSVKCTRSLMLSGGSQVHCGWPFKYRATAATKAFEDLIAKVSSCLGESARVTKDLNVNHPDFYDLQTFRLGDQEIGVSLKDKAALSETYVFLRLTLPD